MSFLSWCKNHLKYRFFRIIFYFLIAFLLAFISTVFTAIPVHAVSGFWGNNTDDYENVNIVNCAAWNCSGSAQTLSAVSYFDGDQNNNSGTIRRYVYTTNSFTTSSNYGSMILENINKYKGGYLYHATDYFCLNTSLNISNTPITFYAGLYGQVTQNSSEAAPTYFTYNISSVDNTPFSTFVNSRPWSNCYQLDSLWVPNQDTVMIAYKFEPSSSFTTRWYMIGHKFEELGIYTNTIENIISNSGFATASSVSQVQRSVNEVKQEISDVNDSINNSSVDSSDDTLSDLQDNLPTNSVISDILLLPVRLLQSIINSLGGTCSSFNLGSLYGTNLVMPCIDIEHYVGSAIWTFIDLVFSGMFVLVIRKKFIEIWENITNLRGGGNEVD